MASWLSRFPQIQLNGYKLSQQQAFIRSSNEAGPARQRQIYSSPPSYTPITILFPNNLEFRIFEAWFVYEINYGASWFTMPIKNGSGINDADVRFISSYEATPMTGGVDDYDCPWSVTGTLEIRLLPIMSEEQLSIIVNPSGTYSDALYDGLTYLSDSTYYLDVV